MPTTTEVEATLNINAIGERTDFAGTAVSDLSAEEIRYDQAQYSEGILQPVEAYEVNEGGGGTMDVIVGSGTAKTDYMIIDGDIAGQGSYLVRLDDVTKTITLSAADPSSPRTDEIWLVVLDDAYDSSTKALPIFAVREGDPGAGSPGPDASWEAAVKLADVTVPAGIADITEATISDTRVYTDLAFANGGTVPVGGGFLWFSTSAPTGHILARGQLLDPADYPRLFQIWGTTYGGDGTSTFGVPDLRQRFPIGKADSGVASGLGDTGGAIDHVHTGPSHTHSGPSHSHSGPSHSHSNPSTNSAGSHAHSQGSTGSDSHSHGLGPGYAFMNLHSHRVRIKRINVASWNYNVGADLQQDSTTTNTSTAVQLGGNTDSDNHNHTNPNVNSNGNHSHSQGNTGAAGTGQTGNAGTGQTGAAGTGNTGGANPPFLAVEYAIRAA